MFFVTTKHPDYVLFSMTPSEHAAIGVTERQEVHLLVRDETGGWHVFAKWSGSVFSHTDFMVAWHYRDEPENPLDLLEVLPAELRDAARQVSLH